MNLLLHQYKEGHSISKFGRTIFDCNVSIMFNLLIFINTDKLVFIFEANKIYQCHKRKFYLGDG